ncbi:unknown [Clostridium sp. CAG:217]|nr:unknown [Clostridium sp. CAG:217]
MCIPLCPRQCSQKAPAPGNPHGNSRTGRPNRGRGKSCRRQTRPCAYRPGSHYPRDGALHRCTAYNRWHPPMRHPQAAARHSAPAPGTPVRRKYSEYSFATGPYRSQSGSASGRTPHPAGCKTHRHKFGPSTSAHSDRNKSESPRHSSTNGSRTAQSHWAPG